MKTLSTLFFAFAAMTCAAQSSISGEIVLKETKPFSKDVFVRTFGKDVTATTYWRVDDFFGAQTVFAAITVTNTASKPLGCHYYVAFFDEKKSLVGAAAQGSFGKEGLKPGEHTQFGSCLIKLPKDKYKQIKFYEAVLYEYEPEKK